MRVFVALASDQLEGEYVDQVCENLTCAPLHHPFDRHLTLCFLGERSEIDVCTLVNKIESIYNKKLFKPLEWESLKVADFPPDKAKVWAIIGEKNSELMSFQQQIAQICEAESTYEFTPHVSLAYIKHPTNLTRVFERDWLFDQLVLYRSLSQEERNHFDTKGGWAKPRYEILKRWDLKA